MMLGAAKKWGVCILGHVSLIEGIRSFCRRESTAWMEVTTSTI